MQRTIPERFGGLRANSVIVARADGDNVGRCCLKLSVVEMKTTHRALEGHRILMEFALPQVVGPVPTFQPRRERRYRMARPTRLPCRLEVPNRLPAFEHRMFEVRLRVAKARDVIDKASKDPLRLRIRTVLS